MSARNVLLGAFIGSVLMFIGWVARDLTVHQPTCRDSLRRFQADDAGIACQWSGQSMQLTEIDGHIAALCTCNPPIVRRPGGVELL